MRGVRDGDCLPMSDAASMSGGMLFLLWLCATPEVADRILGQRLPLSHVAEHVPDAQESVDPPGAVAHRTARPKPIRTSRPTNNAVQRCTCDREARLAIGVLAAAVTAESLA